MFPDEAKGHFCQSRDALVEALRHAIRTASIPPCRNTQMEWLTHIATLDALSQVAAGLLSTDDVRQCPENETELIEYLYASLARHLALARSGRDETMTH